MTGRGNPTWSVPHWRTCLGLVLLAVVTAACSDEPLTAPPELEPTTVSASAQGAEPAHHELTRLVAAALQNDGVRNSVYRQLAQSPVREGKVHLQRFLRGPGQGLLRAMSERGNVPSERIEALLGQVGSFEMYMPVPEHRAVWTGGPEILVATTLEDFDRPFGVSLEGHEAMLNWQAPPSVPTLVIVPAESFDEHGAPYRSAASGAVSGSALGGNMLDPDALDPIIEPCSSGDPYLIEPECGGGGGGGGGYYPPPSSGEEWTGLWITEVHVGDSCLYECMSTWLGDTWPKGGPEFEMWLENAETGAKISCVDEDLSVEPYKWNMEKRDYTTPFLLAEEAKVPKGVPLSVSMWEDDDGRCIRRVDKYDDPVREFLEELFNAGGQVYGVFERGSVSEEDFWAIYNSSITLIDIVKGDDDFVGVAAGSVALSGSATKYTLYNPHQTPTGWLKAFWGTRTVN